MKLRMASRETGIALIMVMIVIAVLAIIVGAFAYSMRVETILARNSENEPEFDWLGRSGVELARYLVGQQLAIGMEPYDSLNQKWAGGWELEQHFGERFAGEQRGRAREVFDQDRGSGAEV